MVGAFTAVKDLISEITVVSSIRPGDEARGSVRPRDGCSPLRAVEYRSGLH